MMKAVAPRHMAIGASLFLGYDLIIELFRHHDETNQRPMFVDHMIACGLIGMVGGYVYLNTIRGSLQGMLIGL